MPHSMTTYIDKSFSRRATYCVLTFFLKRCTFNIELTSKTPRTYYYLLDLIIIFPSSISSLARFLP